MSENRALTVRQPAGGGALINSLEDAAKMAKYVADSGLFACKNQAEALVKIVAGREMGFDPIASMTSIHIIEGKPSPGADIIAAAIRRKGSGYDYEIQEINDEACAVMFYRCLSDGSKKEMDSLRYTMKEAKEKGWNLTAGGKEKMTWRQKPANMLFARVITDGKRFFCPDVLTGVFDRDEIESIPNATAVVSPAVEVIRDPGRQLRGPTPFHAGGEPFNPANDPDNPERPTALTVDDNGHLHDEVDEMNEVRRRIDGLVAELNIPAEKVKQRLVTHYGGAESYHHIHDLDELKRLEKELLTSKAARQNPKKTTTATAPA